MTVRTLPNTPGRFIVTSPPGELIPMVVTDDPGEARRLIGSDPRTWEHTPDVTVVHAAGQRPAPGGHWGWQLWSDGVLTAGYWSEPGDRSGWPRSLHPATEGVIDLMVLAGRVDDQAIWRPLLTATSHQATQVDRSETSDEWETSGQDAELHRHDVTLLDGTVHTLWQVITGWWAWGEEDADAGVTHWISTDRAAARRHYRNCRPRRADFNSDEFDDQAILDYTD